MNEPKQTAKTAQSRRLFYLSLVFIAGFLAACVLTFCGVLTPAVAGMIAIGCLIVFTGLNGFAQRGTNPAFSKIDLLTSLLLVLVLIVLIILYATGLWV